MNRYQTPAVIGAMLPEIELLRSRLQDTTVHTVGAFTLYEGRLNGKRIILTLSGIGKVNAAVATTLAVQRFGADYVINTGSAGGLAGGLAVGDVVIGSETAHHDVDVTAFGYSRGQVPQLPARFSADPVLVEVARNAAQAFPLATVHSGLIVSGDRFIHDSGSAAAIRSDFPDVQAVEMEAAAIAQSCIQLNVPFVVIRALSDAADEQAGISFDAFLQQAGVHSAEMVERLIAELP